MRDSTVSSLKTDLLTNLTENTNITEIQRQYGYKLDQEGENRLSKDQAMSYIMEILS